MNILFSLLLLTTFNISTIKNNPITFQSNLYKIIHQFTNNKFESLTSYNYQKGKTCISPLSIYQILSLVSNGANKETQTEILQTLTQDKNITSKTQINLNLNNENILNIYENNNNISIANAILSKISISENFILISKRYKAFNSILTNVDQVNKWCKEKTNGKIDKILDNINGIELILLNAVYFNYNWKFPFEKSETYEKNFYNENKTISKVQMMSKKFYSINYYEDNNIQMIELPYKDENISMIIILPSKDKFKSTFDYLNKEENNIENLIKKLELRNNIILKLPKFEFKYEISLKDSLIKMNMKKAFNDNADFSKITKEKNLKIDNIIHKTYIKVDELGTESAAITEIIMTECAMNINDIIYMNVDHFFIFMIRDKRIIDINKNEIMLFIGNIDNL